MIFFFVVRRAVLVKESTESGGKARDVTPQGFAVRSLAQEYGGGAFAVQGDVVVFSNYTDQRLYKQTIGGNKELNLRLTATIVLCGLSCCIHLCSPTHLLQNLVLLSLLVT